MWDTWIKEHIPEAYVAKKNEQLMTMEFYTGSKFYCLSAEHPDRLRGLAADLLIVDECAIIDDSFYEVVRPLLSDRFHDGEALYISTPKGYNPVIRLISLSLLSASRGVSELISSPFIWSRMATNTGSSSWNIES